MAVEVIHCKQLESGNYRLILDEPYFGDVKCDLVGVTTEVEAVVGGESKTMTVPYEKITYGVKGQSTFNVDGATSVVTFDDGTRFDIPGASPAPASQAEGSVTPVESVLG